MNLIGRATCAAPKFRWHRTIEDQAPATLLSRVVRRHGEAILVPGYPQSESSTRAVMAKAREALRRDRSPPNASLPNSLVYSPIEAWSNDDVVVPHATVQPLGHNNKDLLTMYQGASADGECHWLSMRRLQAAAAHASAAGPARLSKRTSQWPR